MTLHRSAVVRRAFAAMTAALIIAGGLMPAAALAASGAPPVPRDDLINTLEEVPTSGNVLTNDKNQAGGSLTVTGFVAVSPSVGTLTIATNGAYTFTPATNWTGTASTTYTVANANKSRTGNIYITVRASNDAPVANADTLTLVEDSVSDVTADILANDTDPDGDTLVVTAVSGATGGTVDLSFELVTFTPDADLCGSNAAGFSYTVGDGFGTTSTSSVSIDVTCVNDDPVAVDDTATGTEDAQVPITATDLAANDIDVDSSTLTVTAAADASGGSVVLESGAITFTPDADLCGSGAAGFDYTVEDGDGGSDTGHVSIDLGCVNDAPVAVDDTVAGTEDTEVSIDSGDLTANDTDVDGGDTLSVSGVASPTGGSVLLDGATITFTPDANACGDGAGSFDYTVDDGNTGTDTGHVTVDVTCVNDDPAAGADSASGTEDTHVTIDAAGLLANDTDVESVSLTLTGVSGATGGSVSLDGDVITFVPDADLCGTAVAGFDYTAEDGNGASATAHVTIDLTCVNDAPVATDDTAAATEDTASDVTDGLLDNDDDVDGDSLVIASVAGANGGSVDLTAGVVTFTPAPDVCGTGAGSFEYTLSDGNGGTDTALVTVDVTCVNDAPVADDDTASGTEDTGIVVDGATMTDDDADADGDTLSVTAVANATGGTALLEAGNVTFTPSPNVCGTAAAGFDYTVDDGNTGTDTGHVTIDLTCVNDAPVATDDTATVASASGAADHDVLANDNDVDGDTLVLVSASVDPAAGATSVVAGKVRFAPAASFAGEATITYVVGDGLLTDSGVLTVTVGPDVTAPVQGKATVAFATGRVDESAPLRVSWLATDASSGVKSYEVQVSTAGGTFRSVYTGPATSIVKLYPFRKSLVWRVRATDNADNVSAWVLSTKRSLAPYQNSNAKLVYRGSWSQVGSAKSSGRGYAVTKTRFSRITLTFTGRAVLYVAPKTSTSGWVKVYVDGKLVGRYNQYRSSTALGQIIARATWTANATHTIRIASDSTGKRVAMDAFIVLK